MRAGMIEPVGGDVVVMDRVGLMAISRDNEA